RAADHCGSFESPAELWRATCKVNRVPGNAGVSPLLPGCGWHTRAPREGPGRTASGEGRAAGSRHPPLLQGRAEFAEPTLLYLCFGPLQDGYHLADPPARQIPGRPRSAILRIEMAGLDQFIVAGAGSDDFGHCGVVDRVNGCQNLVAGQ